jgi:putative redox protein
VREIVVTQAGGDAYDMDIKGRHTIRFDQPESAGGTDTGPNPTDVWVGALGACVAYYAGKYLRTHNLGGGATVTTTYKAGIGPNRVTKIDINVDAPAVGPDHRAGFDEALHGCTVHHSLEQPPQVRISSTA